jgi:Mn-containing catalase
MKPSGQTKPHYLGLLNAISIAERNAGVYLKAWADATSDAELKQALTFVAARETTHGEVFRQRIERLGYALRERDDPTLAERLRLYGDPTISDRDKVRFGRRDEQAEGERPDPLAAIEERIADESVDALTRDTLRWFVAEERDSGELLRAAYARITATATT